MGYLVRGKTLRHEYWRPLGCKLWCGPRGMALGVGHKASCILSFLSSLLILSPPKGKSGIFWKAGAPTQKVGSWGTVVPTSRRGHSVDCSVSRAKVRCLPHFCFWGWLWREPLVWIYSKAHILMGLSLDLYMCCYPVEESTALFVTWRAS